MPTVTLTDADWTLCKERFDAIMQQYIINGCHHNRLTYLIATVFRPLARRYRDGERTEALFDAMWEVI